MKNKRCYICHTTQGLELHHIYPGKNRKASDKHGFTVWLCAEHHRGKNSPHLNRSIDLALKQICQTEFERAHSRQEFIKIIGSNYL